LRHDPATTEIPLTECDREPIHIPGSIQPHGFLFSLTAGMKIGSLSANAAQHLGRPAASLLGMAVDELLDSASPAIVAKFVPQGEPSTRLNDVRICGTAPLWEAFLHTGVTGALLEVKLPGPSVRPSVSSILASYDGASRRMRKASDVLGICQCLADEVQHLTGYDRVNVYRFTAEWNGEVIAEANAGLMPAFLGLFFPAADIPAQARALYTINPERHIPDIHYIPVPLVSSTAEPVDLSHAMLRSVSPVHLEYLRNMAVGASMSVSILRDGELWGLVACHHHEARYVLYELRQAAVLLAHLAAWQMAVAEDTEITRRNVGVKAIEAALLHDTTSDTHYRDALLTHGDGLLKMLHASGFAFSLGDNVSLLGDTPAETDLAGLIDHLVGHLIATGAGIFATDHLRRFYAPAAAWPNTAGMIAVLLGGSPRSMMIWFRPAITQTVTWAGAPAKTTAACAPGAEAGLRLSPRKSFAAWTETVTGRARPWAPHEMAAANGLRDVIVDLVLRRTAALEQMNSELRRSNDDLESFAYVAAHDLKEPLRRIETFGTLLERVFRLRNLETADVKPWFEGIQASSRRLRTLIDDLAEYSRLGHHADPFTAVALDKLVAEVRSDLATLIDETAAGLEADKLPVLVCDQSQMRQVLQNIVQNAIKYRHKDRPPRIHVSATVRPADTPFDAPMLELLIQDNAIGIEARHCEQVFEPFKRLHSSDAYDGSGIGLAICRKIVERHHGTITVSSVIGEGSIFMLCLPMRPSNEPDKIA
jgi:light-regulated signal transduction histidine kinase (bacteriophytochrome)